MQFRLLDTIEAFEKDARLVGSKHVRPEEEYLADHFPEFPVLPGVFMLEAATQASAWLLRLSDDFFHSTVTLQEARNVKYADFVKPGERLRVETQLTKKEERLATFKVAGSVEGRTTLTGRLTLERYNLADTSPHLADVDERLRVYLRKWRDEITAELAAPATA
ncbi:MAG: 3-hydroxyacyl-ACP dehydratase FabZ family protein [Planctomycetota bacterium]